MVQVKVPQRVYSLDDDPRYILALELAKSRRKEVKQTLPESMNVVEILKGLNVNNDTLIAALLSSHRLTLSLPISEIEERFGEIIASLVSNVRTLNAFRMADNNNNYSGPQQAERIRRLLLATVGDVRAVLIKLAFRLALLRIIKTERSEIRDFVANETMDIFAPLANRLGLGQIKWEMEDLAFRYLNPQSYKNIAKALEARRVDREEYVRAFQEKLISLLNQNNIEGEVSGRPKHIYSIWKKMESKGRSLNELFDILALRIIVSSTADCYAVLGLIHTHWRTIPAEFDDYIANPKTNGYRSLHTVVIGPEKKPIEIQIRTREMHEFAELGFAAHWRYKEKSNADNSLEQAIYSLRNLLDEEGPDSTLVESFKSEAFNDRVFVFTPKNEVIELPVGATPLDFAYHIHSEVGHRCRGAKVDGKIVPLTRTLNNGEYIEILTSKHAQPNRDWMSPNNHYLVSPSARSKVRSWFNQHDNEEHKNTGQRLLDATLKRFGVSKKVVLKKLLQHFKHNDEEALTLALGREEIRQAQLDGFFMPDAEVVKSAPSEEKKAGDKTTRPEKVGASGVTNLLTKVAQCCRPLPGDKVIGYITHGKGVAVHRKDCPNILNLTSDKKPRLVSIDWHDDESWHEIYLDIRAFDRPGLRSDVSQTLVNEGGSVVREFVRMDDSTDGVELKLLIQVKGSEQLGRIMNKLLQVKNVFEVRRLTAV